MSRLNLPEEVHEYFEHMKDGFAPCSVLLAGEGSPYADFVPGRFEEDVRHLQGLGVSRRLSLISAKAAHDRDSRFTTDLDLYGVGIVRGVRNAAKNRLDSITIEDLKSVIDAIDNPPIKSNDFTFNKPSRCLAVYLLLRSTEMDLDNLPLQNQPEIPTPR